MKFKQQFNYLLYFTIGLGLIIVLIYSFIPLNVSSQ